jgi:hypothetical protein
VATLSTATPELAVVVSKVIPVCKFELTREKTRFAVPPDAKVVPPTTVIVSDALLPTEVVIAPLESVAEGGSLIRMVTIKVADTLFESVAVKV